MFRLGVVTDPLPEHERFTGWLAIPYLDRQDRPLQMRFRCMENHEHRDLHHGKYMSLSEDPPRMFNVRALHQAVDTIDLAEGELDAVVLEKVGLHAVAVAGVNNWMARHRRMLAGFSVVRVWGDPDEAGAKFNRKVEAQLRQAKAMRLRLGDVTDTYRAGGARALLELVGE